MFSGSGKRIKACWHAFTARMNYRSLAANCKSIAVRTWDADSIAIAVIAIILTLFIGVWMTLNHSLQYGNHTVYAKMLEHYSEQAWNFAFLLSGLASFLVMLTMCWAWITAIVMWLAFLWVYTALLLMESRAHALAIGFAIAMAVLCLFAIVLMFKAGRHGLASRENSRVYA